ncbi:MAG: PDGLE domain-containing protein [Chloroflexi bacterium]|nr:PDGLE domain-containing protein [Chloroflexota bacterium]
MLLLSVLPLLNDAGQAKPLHIPDGFLSLAMAGLCWLVTIGLLALAVRRTRQTLGERQAPFMGVMAAFIFAAQMINFPILGGTSGHLLGGSLAALTLGPWPAMLVMTAVLAVQALLFQDGGLLALGANILNMGLIPVLITYGVYRSVARQARGVQLAVAGIVSWLSVMAAALATSLQLWLSGTSDLAVVVPAMLGVHAVIGIGEALITVAALAFILRTRPELVEAAGATGRRGDRRWIAVGLAVAAAVVLLAPLASADPDGLERVAEDLGFLEQQTVAAYTVLPDYTIPFLGETSLSTIVAGLIGVALVAAVVIGAARLLRRPSDSADETGSAARPAAP